MSGVLRGGTVFGSIALQRRHPHSSPYCGPAPVELGSGSKASLDFPNGGRGLLLRLPVRGPSESEDAVTASRLFTFFFIIFLPLSLRGTDLQMSLLCIYIQIYRYQQHILVS